MAHRDLKSYSAILVSGALGAHSEPDDGGRFVPKEYNKKASSFMEFHILRHKPKSSNNAHTEFKHL